MKITYKSEPTEQCMLQEIVKDIKNIKTYRDEY